MPGKPVSGQRGFAPKEGVNFDWLLKVWMHSDERALLDMVRGSESRADFARAAIRRALLDASREQGEYVERERFAEADFERRRRELADWNG